MAVSLCRQVLRRGLASTAPLVLLAVAHTTADALTIFHGKTPSPEFDKVRTATHTRAALSFRQTVAMG